MVSSLRSIIRLCTGPSAPRSGRQALAVARAQPLDGVGEVDLGDRVVAAFDPDFVRLHQHLAVGPAPGRLEAVGGELDQEPERVLEVDRVHEAAVLDPRVLDAALVEPLDRLAEGRGADRQRQVVHAAGLGRGAAPVGLAALVGEDGDQPAVAGVEVEVALGAAVEVRLLEDEGHAEHALPEVDRGLPVGADQRDVMHALGSAACACRSSLALGARPVDELRLVVAASQRIEHRAPAGKGDEKARLGGAPFANLVGDTGIEPVTSSM